MVKIVAYLRYFTVFELEMMFDFQRRLSNEVSLRSVFSFSLMQSDRNSLKLDTFQIPKPINQSSHTYVN